MKYKALLVESSRLFQNIIKEIFSNAGVECSIFSTAKEALESSHDGYDFILVSRTLEDLTGELFLKRYGLEYGLSDALTILLTSEKPNKVMLDANQAGYKLVFNKNNIEELHTVITKILNVRALKLEANILFIEDSKSVAGVIISLFKENNASIYHVSHLSEMREIFSEKKFDLVITDYYLHNNETGDDVIEYIRKYDNQDKSSIPILVVSGETDPEKRTSFLRNGASDFIVKPYNEDELLVRSSNLIKNHKLLQDFKQQKQQLVKLALTDHLTGLYNRHSLYDLGPKYISNALRHETPLSLLVIDLDHFKKVNDTHGHSTGDLVLKDVAQIMQDACRTEDIVARFGGEEFIMLLSNCDLENAINKAEKLREAIERSKPEGLLVTSSIGVALLSSDDNMDTLFDRADEAVYKAKETGRNKVVA